MNETSEGLPHRAESAARAPLTIPAELRQQLEAMSLLFGKTASSILTEALASYLADFPEDVRSEISRIAGLIGQRSEREE